MAPNLHAGCCTTPEPAPGSIRVESGVVTIDLLKCPELKPVGGAVKVFHPERKINLIIAHVHQGRYYALSRNCTHGGMQVTFNPKRNTMHCTSFGHSEFALDGTRLHGPAKRPLKTYAVEVADGMLRIEVGGNG